MVKTPGKFPIFRAIARYFGDDNPFHVYDALMLLDAEKTRRCSRDWRTGNDERQ